MIALSACTGRCEVFVWASHWRRGRYGIATGLTKVAHQSAVCAQQGPYCSHTEERISDIRRPHSDLVDSLGRDGRSVVAVLCDGGFSNMSFQMLNSTMFKLNHFPLKKAFLIYSAFWLIHVLYIQVKSIQDISSSTNGSSYDNLLQITLYEMKKNIIITCVKQNLQPSGLTIAHYKLHKCGFQQQWPAEIDMICHIWRNHELSH